jgi:hypothetical protein
VKAEGAGDEREDDFMDNFIYLVLFSFLRFEPLVERILYCLPTSNWFAFLTRVFIFLSIVLWDRFGPWDQIMASIGYKRVPAYWAYKIILLAEHFSISRGTEIGIT